MLERRSTRSMNPRWREGLGFDSQYQAACRRMNGWVGTKKEKRVLLTGYRRHELMIHCWDY